jgi:glycerophosphoryl diester phosphodiesterase
MTEIAAHRGGALLWPENSRVAFENTARLLAVEQVEFDVHFSADRQLVVIHDATLDRMTDGIGPVCEQPWEALSRFVVRGTGGQRLLLLDEVIEIFRPTTIALRIELKANPGRLPYAEMPQAVIGTLRRTGMLERSIITSFQLEPLREAPDAPRRVWLIVPDLQSDVGIAGLCMIARNAGVPALGLRCNQLNAETVSKVRTAGLGVGAWAVNDRMAIVAMLGLAVDVFTTDRPDLALAIRAGDT